MKCICNCGFECHGPMDLYEHYQEAHGVPEVRYYSLVPEKPLAPSREATEWLETRRLYANAWNRRTRRKVS